MSCRDVMEIMLSLICWWENPSRTYSTQSNHGHSILVLELHGTTMSFNAPILAMPCLNSLLKIPLIRLQNMLSSTQYLTSGGIRGIEPPLAPSIPS